MNLKKVGWNVIKAQWAGRIHTTTSSETAIKTTAQTTRPNFLPASLQPRPLTSMRAFLWPLTGSVRSSMGQTLLSRGYRNQLQNCRGFAEQGWGGQQTDVGPHGSGIRFSLSPWGSFRQILLSLSIAQYNRIWPSTLKKYPLTMISSFINPS